MKPFRIPARNKNKPNLLFNNLPSPRTELLVVPDLSIPIPKKRPEVMYLFVVAQLLYLKSVLEVSHKKFLISLFIYTSFK